MDESHTFSDQRGRLPRKEAARLAGIILKKEKKKLPVNIIFTDDKNLRVLNLRFRGKNRPTDVLAFPADPDEDLLGEVYISIDTARRQSYEDRITLKKELLCLVTHGVLHLCGYDHQNDKDAELMRRQENRYISKI